MRMTIHIRRGTAGDVQQVGELLEEAGVGNVGIEEWIDHFLLAIHGETGRLVGTVGMERYDHCCLLRSLVLMKEIAARPEGLQLIQLFLAHAQTDGVEELYLFTAVPHIFIHMGFEEIPFDEIPLPMQDSPHAIQQIGRGVPMRKRCVTH
jgi:amino-acid N-acetyltransferase